MLKCLNYDCISNKEGKCNLEIVYCDWLINPVHTPNEVENQLKYAKEQEEKKYTLKKDKPMNAMDYEIEYNKLKQENINFKKVIHELDDKLEKTNNEYIELQRLHGNQKINIHNLLDKNEKLEKENNQFKEKNKPLEEKLENYRLLKKLMIILAERL